MRARRAEKHVGRDKREARDHVGKETHEAPEYKACKAREHVGHTIY